MTPETRDQLAPFGITLSPDMVLGNQKVFAPLVRPLPAGASVLEDQPYGEHERHRLDLYKPADASGSPVLVYIHGGGFIGGAKSSPTTPFYANIGRFAAANGMLGVCANYRLAPTHRWPSGAEDLGTLVAWLRANVADHGGDPDRIILFGQSAGAAHVASYVAHPESHPAGEIGICGAIMSSGIFDPASAEANPFNTAYYGEADPLMSAIPGLTKAAIPLLFSISEWDIPDFHKQAVMVSDAFVSARGVYPRMHFLAHHNHISPALAIGTPEDVLGPLIVDFVRHTCRA